MEPEKDGRGFEWRRTMLISYAGTIRIRFWELAKPLSRSDRDRHLHEFNIR